MLQVWFSYLRFSFVGNFDWLFYYKYVIHNSIVFYFSRLIESMARYLTSKKKLRKLELRVTWSLITSSLAGIFDRAFFLTFDIFKQFLTWKMTYIFLLKSLACIFEAYSKRNCAILISWKRLLGLDPVIGDQLQVLRYSTYTFRHSTLYVEKTLSEPAFWFIS